MPTPRRPRTVPAVIYDTLLFAAEEQGGIGLHYGYAQHTLRVGRCVWSLLEYAGVVDETGAYALAFTEDLDDLAGDLSATRTAELLALFPVLGAESDSAVIALNRQLASGDDTLVPFAAWAAQLNLVRGE